MAEHLPRSPKEASDALARTVFVLATTGALAFVALVIIFVLR
jgi:hypothetical protein